MKLGLIGSHIEASLSPEIHNAALAQLGIEGSYELLPTTEQELPERLAACYRDGFRGLNVTAPHKANLLPLVASQSELVTTIRSANTLIRTENGWHAESTDGTGLRYALAKWGTILTIGEALVYGSGGFARAVAYELLASGWKVAVCSRRPPDEKWEPIKLLCKEKLSFFTWNDRSSVTKKTKLFVNTIPIGSNGITMMLPLDMCWPSLVFFVDCVYKPDVSPVRSIFIQNGSATQNGIRILLGQAALSFRLWTGKDFPEAVRQQWEVST